MTDSELQICGIGTILQIFTYQISTDFFTVCLFFKKIEVTARGHYCASEMIYGMLEIKYTR